MYERAVRELGDGLGSKDLLALHDHPPTWPECEQELPPRLYDALTTARPVRIRYVNVEGKFSARTIRPMACFACGPWTYIRAFCQKRGELRTFGLDRIMAHSVGEPHGISAQRRSGRSVHAKQRACP